jgi:hypothetical protein
MTITIRFYKFAVVKYASPIQVFYNIMEYEKTDGGDHLLKYANGSQAFFPSHIVRDIEFS